MARCSSFAKAEQKAAVDDNVFDAQLESAAFSTWPSIWEIVCVANS